MRYLRIGGFVVCAVVLVWLLTSGLGPVAPSRADGLSVAVPYPTPSWYAYALVGQGDDSTPVCAVPAATPYAAGRAAPRGRAGLGSATAE